jgi:hypothetical protein
MSMSPIATHPDPVTDEKRERQLKNWSRLTKGFLLSTPERTRIENDSITDLLILLVTK